MLSFIEIQAEAISNSLRVDPAPAVAAGENILNGVASENEFEIFYSAASCIVEPRIKNEEAASDYYQFMEDDAENWVGWINSTFGSQWGKVAEVVSKYGY